MKMRLYNIGKRDFDGRWYMGGEVEMISTYDEEMHRYPSAKMWEVDYG